MSDLLTILAGDAVEQLKRLADGSVHCVVTSPPYDKLRNYKGLSEADFQVLGHELYRVLCPGGILCWNVGDSMVDGSESLTSSKQKIFFRESVGFRIHDTMIYERTNFGHPERARYHQAFEYVFILSKGAPRVFNPITDKKNAWAGTGTFGRNTVRESDGSMGERPRNIIAEYGMRTNVWRGKTRGQEDCCKGAKHPAMMPKWLARDLILSWSNPGDVILDPMAGSGTTGQMALETGRKTILIEAERDYLELIRDGCQKTPGLQLA